MEQTPVFDYDTGRLSSDLDRLEIKVGKIGLNSREAALSILGEMDSVYERMQSLESENTRKQAEAQFSGIAGKLRQEAGPFMRDLGGVSVLQKAREAARPPEDHWWWYLDARLAEKRRAALRRSLITLGAVVVVLVVLGVVYSRFLAPDPKTAARYGHEQSARDSLINSDMTSAMAEVEQGLLVAPNDPVLLTLRGVIKEKQGDQAGASQDFAAAQKGFSSKEAFLLARSQAYSQANMANPALDDAQAVIQMDPKSAEAYLVAGNAYEAIQHYQEALNMYRKGFDAANASGQTELAAMAKMREAMVMQSMTGQSQPTLTPAP